MKECCAEITKRKKLLLGVALGVCTVAAILYLKSRSSSQNTKEMMITVHQP